MPEKTQPPLVIFESLLLYPFLLGLFNSVLLSGLFFVFGSRLFNLIVSKTTMCACHLDDFSFESALFPAQMPLSHLLLGLGLYVSCCVIEALAYTYQSSRRLGYRKGLTSLPRWLLRTLLKNSAGLCLLLSAMAQPSTVSAYRLIGLAAGFFIYWSQQGSYSQFSLGLNTGRVWPQPGKLSFKIVRAVLIIYYLLLVSQTDVLLPLSIMLIIFPGSLWVMFKNSRNNA